MSTAAGTKAAANVSQSSQAKARVLAHTKDCLDCLVERCNSPLSAHMLQCDHQKKVNRDDGYQEARELFFRFHKSSFAFACSRIMAPEEPPRLRAQRAAQNPFLGDFPGLATIMNRIEELLPQGRVTKRWWNPSDGGKLEPEGTGHFQVDPHGLGEMGPGARYVNADDPDGKQYLSATPGDNE